MRCVSSAAAILERLHPAVLADERRHPDRQVKVRCAGHRHRVEQPVDRWSGHDERGGRRRDRRGARRHDRSKFQFRPRAVRHRSISRSVSAPSARTARPADYEVVEAPDGSRGAAAALFRTMGRYRQDFLPARARTRPAPCRQSICAGAPASSERARFWPPRSAAGRIGQNCRPPSFEDPDSAMCAELISRCGRTFPSGRLR
jgi:hypothetical protein